MKAFLMYRDRDFDLQRATPANEVVLTKDLELDTLFSAMAEKDPFILEVTKKAILWPPRMSSPRSNTGRRR